MAGKNPATKRTQQSAESSTAVGTAFQGFTDEERDAISEPAPTPSAPAGSSISPTSARSPSRRGCSPSASDWLRAA
jgi:hypothetical protein